MSVVGELRTMLDSEFFPDEIDSSAWIVEHGEKMLALVEAAQAWKWSWHDDNPDSFDPEVFFAAEQALAAALAAVGPGQEAT